MMLALLPLLFSNVIAFDFGESAGDMALLPSGDFIDLISRDAENVPSPAAFGSKYITGGAGEGVQKLREEENFQERQEVCNLSPSINIAIYMYALQVKSDNVLPAYCEPPNPCPVGYTAADGCLEEFENSAEFSRNYQAQQHCICDQEHMFNCAEKEASDLSASLQELLDEHSLHRNMIAKKFHEKRSGDELPPRRKRSIRLHPTVHVQKSKKNPYLQGNVLKTVSKKDGRNVW
ncbi:Seven B Two (Mammalian 7BT prohormone convertase chaperone) [Trichostrongylus colubriformis]|uniref:Neuroendocrine protein 7B2 n=1 Tax=Trichostrongylus colubriformis TaxID=6319 RepID=A0AAN8FVS7_TRICO